MSHQKCSTLFFVTASFDSFGFVRNASTQCGVTWIPLCARDGSVITRSRGEGETLSHHVVSTQCAEGLRSAVDTVTLAVHCS